MNPAGWLESEEVEADVDMLHCPAAQAALVKQIVPSPVAQLANQGPQTSVLTNIAASLAQSPV